MRTITKNKTRHVCLILVEQKVHKKLLVMKAENNDKTISETILRLINSKRYDEL